MDTQLYFFFRLVFVCIELEFSSPKGAQEVANCVGSTAMWEPRQTSPATSRGGFESNFKGSRGLPRG